MSWFGSWYQTLREELKGEEQRGEQRQPTNAHGDDDDDLRRDCNSDDEDTWDVQNQRDFLDFEIQIPSLSAEIHGWELLDTSLPSADSQNIRNQKEFFDIQRIRDQTLERPRSVQGLRDWVGRLSGLNRIYEARSEQTATRPPPSGDCGMDLEASSTGKDHHEILYDILCKRPGCQAQHHAFLKLSTLGSDAKVDMALSPCLENMAANSERKWSEAHEATFFFDARKRKRLNPDDIDICKEIRRHRHARLPLCLCFDHSSMWPRYDPDRYGRSLQSISLLAALGQERSYKAHGLEARQSRLALCLVSSVGFLYPGPWIQNDWDTRALHVLCSQQDEAVDDLSSRIYVSCGLHTDWKSTNPVWRQHCNTIDMLAGNDLIDDVPDFFLSLAQLLLDISGINFDEPPAQTRDKHAWYASLYDKGVEMAEDSLLKSYGLAVINCLQYALLYNNERQIRQSTGMPPMDPVKLAQFVIKRDIVSHLQKHLDIFDQDTEDPLQLQHPGYGHEFTGHSRATKPGMHMPTSSHMRMSSNSRGGRSHQQQFPSYPRAMDNSRSTITLFGDCDELCREIGPAAVDRNEFMNLMEDFKRRFIIPAFRQSQTSPKPIRIAILDTGLTEKGDPFLSSCIEKRLRTDLSRNFIGGGAGSKTWVDSHSHGTHVARLLFRLTRGAEIVVLKVSERRVMDSTRIEELVEALRYAGNEADADIINLSFVVKGADVPHIKGVIDELLSKSKLIFAAASNTGGNGARAYPAKESGVIAVHSTDAVGDSRLNINPPREPGRDNFATLGCEIPSRWAGKDVSISGTSFAAPTAAAIAANVLEFVRCMPREDRERTGGFFTPKGMIELLRLMSSPKGDYDYLRPWKDGMFSRDKGVMEMQDQLRRISVRPLPPKGSLLGRSIKRDNG